jgi:hypothetical protein
VGEDVGEGRPVGPEAIPELGAQEAQTQAAEEEPRRKREE